MNCHSSWEGERIKWLSEVAMLESIIRGQKPYQRMFHGRSRTTPFTSAIRNVLVRGVPALLRSSVLAFFCKPELTRGDAVTVWLFYSNSDRGQVAAFNCQKPGGY